MLRLHVQRLLMLVGFCVSVYAQDSVLPEITSMTGWFVDTTGRVPRVILAQLHQEAVQIEALGFQIAGAFFADTDRPGIQVATEFGNNNGIGFKDKDNGIAIAVFLDKKSASGLAPSVSVAVGRGLEGLLNDSKVGRFLDGTFVPRRKEGKWEQGLIDFIAKIRRYLTDSAADEFKSDSAEAQSWDDVFVFIILFVTLIFFLIQIFYIDQDPRMPGSGRKGGFGGGGFGGGCDRASGGGGSFGGGGASR